MFDIVTYKSSDLHAASSCVKIMIDLFSLGLRRFHFHTISFNFSVTNSSVDKHNVWCNRFKKKKSHFHCVEGCGVRKVKASEVELKHLLSMHSHVMQQAHSCSLLINSINESYQQLVSDFIVIQVNNWCMVTFDNLF